MTAQILVARGIDETGAARRFLKPHLRDLHDPSLFRDMDAAVARLERAINDGEEIAVYGDYDVDGVSSTAIMTRALAFFGGRVRPFLPHRFRDGYGLNRDALNRLRADGCTLAVTVDNGTTRAEVIKEARATGLDVIVTDHHEPGGDLPDCPVVNPKRSDTTYPFAGLAGCGVAFKTVCALAQRLGRWDDPGFRTLLPELLAYAALGTIADVVPLVDENRIFVAIGLKALNATKHAGLRALLKVARCDQRVVQPRDIGFRVGPRINAAGRLDSAQLAYDLLVCEDPEVAAALAEKLDACNRERQRIEKGQAAQAFEQAEALMAERDPAALVLFHPDWHPGVIGIIAARVTETFQRPAALVTTENGEARGSARCFGKTLLHEALEGASSVLRSHGGHAKAAGFTMDPANVDAFRELFEQAVTDQAHVVDPTVPVDAELPIDALSAPLAGEIASLAPFGAAHSEPVFAAYGVRVAGRPRRRGAQEQHIGFIARTKRSSVRAIAFGQAEKEPLLRGAIDMAYVLRERDDGDRYEIHVREFGAEGAAAPTAT